MYMYMYVYVYVYYEYTRYVHYQHSSIKYQNKSANKSIDFVKNHCS